MTTVKLSFSFKRIKNCYFDSLKRHRNAGIFYFMLSFIFLPLQFIMALPEVLKYEGYDFRYFVGVAECYTGVSAIFFTMITTAAAIILPSIIFSYMQNRRAVDVYHSLPYKREELLLANTASGLTLIYIPIIINFLILAGAAVFFIISAAMPSEMIMHVLGAITAEMLCWMAFVFITFVMTVFTAVQVGSIFDTAAFSLVLNGSFAAIYALGYAFASSFLYGFGYDNMMEDAYLLSPITTVIGRLLISSTDSTRIFNNNVTFLLWVIIAVLLLVVTMILYKNRKSEKAEELGTFGPLSNYIRAVGTLGGGTLVGMMFGMSFQIQTTAAMITCIFFGSLLVYHVGDVILARRIRISKKTLIAGSVTSLAIVSAVGIIVTGAFGFVTRIPKQEDVASVRIMNYIGRYQNETSNYKREDREVYYSGFDLTTPESIENIIRLHTSQVENYKKDSHRSIFESQNMGGDINQIITIEYTLKSGRKMERRYRGLYQDSMQSLLKLETDKEFIVEMHPIFRIEQNDIAKINIVNKIEDTEQIYLSNEVKTELILALREELLNQPLSEIDKGKSLGIIELTLINDETKYATQDERFGAIREDFITSEVVLTESFVKSLAILKEHSDIEFIKDPSHLVTEAYITIGDSYYGSSITQPSMEERNIDYELKEFLEKAEGDYYNFIEVDINDVEALMAQSFDISSIAEPRVNLLYKAEGANPDAIGYTFIPLSVLSEDMQKELVLRTYHRSGSWTLRRNGIFLENEQMQAISEFIEQIGLEDGRLPEIINFK